MVNMKIIESMKSFLIVNNIKWINGSNNFMMLGLFLLLPYLLGSFIALTLSEITFQDFASIFANIDLFFPLLWIVTSLGLKNKSSKILPLARNLPLITWVYYIVPYLLFFAFTNNVSVIFDILLLCVSSGYALFLLILAVRCILVYQIKNCDLENDASFDKVYQKSEPVGLNGINSIFLFYFVGGTIIIFADKILKVYQEHSIFWAPALLLLFFYPATHNQFRTKFKKGKKVLKRIILMEWGPFSALPVNRMLVFEDGLELLIGFNSYFFPYGSLEKSSFNHNANSVTLPQNIEIVESKRVYRLSHLDYRHLYRSYCDCCSYENDLPDDETVVVQDPILKKKARRKTTIVSIIVSLCFLLASIVLISMMFMVTPIWTDLEIKDENSIDSIVSKISIIDTRPQKVYIDTIDTYIVTDNDSSSFADTSICEVDTILCYDDSYKPNINGAPKYFRNLYITIQNSEITKVVYITPTYSKRVLFIADDDSSWMVINLFLTLLFLVIIIQPVLFLLFFFGQLEKQQVLSMSERVRLQLKITALLVVLVSLIFGMLHLQFFLFVK